MKEDELNSIFTLAGIKILNKWKLINKYWPEISLDTPWWLVKTDMGLIEIGWRKRVFSISWNDTSFRGIITEDDVTKGMDHVHAWSNLKAIEYLKNLRTQHLSNIF